MCLWVFSRYYNCGHPTQNQDGKIPEKILPVWFHNCGRPHEFLDPQQTCAVPIPCPACFEQLMDVVNDIAKTTTEIAFPQLRAILDKLERDCGRIRGVPMENAQIAHKDFVNTWTGIAAQFEACSANFQRIRLAVLDDWLNRCLPGPQFAENVNPNFVGPPPVALDDEEGYILATDNLVQTLPAYKTPDARQNPPPPRRNSITPPPTYRLSVPRVAPQPSINRQPLESVLRDFTTGQEADLMPEGPVRRQQWKRQVRGGLRP